MLLLHKLLDAVFQKARWGFIITAVVVLSACSDNIKDEPASAVQEQPQTSESKPALKPDLQQEPQPALVPDPTREPAQVMWAVGDEWIQRSYMVSMLQEVVANGSRLTAKLNALAANPSNVPLPLLQSRVSGRQNSQLVLNSINDALLLPSYFRDLVRFFNAESTWPRAVKPVFGYNHQFLLVMSAQQWQPISANDAAVSDAIPYNPALLVGQLKDAVNQQGNFAFAIQVIYDHREKMLGIFATSEGENINYLQALLLNELHQSAEASLLDIPLAIPTWLKDGLKTQQDRIFRLEYMPTQ